MDLRSKETAFKKYDIRGVYPDAVDEGLVASVAGALAEKLFKKGTVVLGMDARESSPSLHASVKNALGKFDDIKVEDAGLMTTPMLTFLVNRLGAAGGIMITASHNPKEYNGMKAVGPGGKPIGGEEMRKLVR